MGACPSCGAELPEGARFCAFCGTRVAVATPAASRQERRTVSILFVDLVGFTERSDRADPEDVRRTLVPFHRRVKEELERFGGTLDKFIGDAVMGVFGAPVAHDDDPVRAVRAALAIVGSLEDLRAIDPGIALRVAVNTGEAIVSFGTGPQVGEAVAGDVVNTASRMQALAPRDAVVIGPLTRRAVGDRFEVEALPPSRVKGKAEALEVWRVVHEREAPSEDRVPFVGRMTELELLTSAFEGVAASRSARAVAIVADAGVGKSRLVREFRARVGARARQLTGSCLPYGEGVAFAPVDRTVRSLLAIPVTAERADAIARLRAHVDALEPDEDERRWLVTTLGAALDVMVDGVSVDAEQIAQAWARVVTAAARDEPVLLVIEDLYHAAPVFVEVLDATTELLASSPVLVLTTTRPSDGPVAPRGAITLPLGPLADEETRALLGAVLVDAGASDEERRTVLERAAGNPLFAIEFARMLVEGGSGAPLSVQGVIGARLDAVPAEERALALDAAVLGEEVWPDALAALASRPVDDVRAGLDDLVGRGLLETRASSLPGADAYGFAHALIRDVAYGRLPRASRAHRHLAAGRWLEIASAGRAEEWAESLARHYATAAELAAASDEGVVASEATPRAIAWLLVAGDRSARIDPAAAFAMFERAAALAPPDSLEREEAVARVGHAGRRSGLLDAGEVLARHREALEIARSRGDEMAIGQALTSVGTQLAVTGDVDGARASLAEAVETLERLPPGRALARAYAHRAEEELFAGDTAEASRFADRALDLLADELDEVAIIALHIRGDARCSMGDLDPGLADLEDALARSERAGRVGDVVTSRNYLAEWRWATQGPAAGLAEWEAALELADRRNVRSQAMYSKGAALSVLNELGEWDRVLAWSGDLLATPEGRLDPAVEVVAQTNRAHVLIARGRLDEVVDPRALLEAADRTQEVAAQAPALSVGSTIALARGERDLAVERLERFEALTADVAPEYRAVDLATVVRLAIAVDRIDLAERLLPEHEPETMRDRLRVTVARAALAEATGDPDAAVAYAELAMRLRAYGDPFEELLALEGRLRLTDDDDAIARAAVLRERLSIPPR
jgi:class 3 adenylate cyclase/tetratricopeptide (TPR) repeat protein